MQITIFSDDQRWEDSIRRYLDYVLPKLDFDKDVLIVNVNLKEVSSDRRIDRKGIRIAEKNYDENTIIILMSFESEESLKKNNPEFNGLMSLSNVGFVRLPDIRQIEPEVKRIISGEKGFDSTAFEVFSHEKKMRTLATLQHSRYYLSLDTEKKNKALKQAREVGLKGSDDEIIEQIEGWKRDSSGDFSGKTLNGIFVDALDTLFNSEWVLNKSVLEVVNDMKKETGKEVFIISDSEPGVIEDAKKRVNLSFQTLSKFALRGAILEIVIDNLSKEEFKEKYNITPQKFITVSEL